MADRSDLQHARAGGDAEGAPPTPATTTPVQAEYDGAGSLAAGYFDRLYAEHGDPWSFATSPYEAAKYRDTLRALPRPRYGNALEVGCSIGVLTRLLASRCDRLLAIDVSQAALAQAATRCAGRGVRFERRALPDDMPAGPFDLVVLSEVGYYWSGEALAAARTAIGRQTRAGGHLLLVHYTGATNYPLTAHDVHSAFGADPAWERITAVSRASYRLDLLGRARRDPGSRA